MIKAQKRCLVGIAHAGSCSSLCVDVGSLCAQCLTDSASAFTAKVDGLHSGRPGAAVREAARAPSRVSATIQELACSTLTTSPQQRQLHLISPARSFNISSHFPFSFSFSFFLPFLKKINLNYLERIQLSFFLQLCKCSCLSLFLYFFILSGTQGNADHPSQSAFMHKLCGSWRGTWTLLANAFSLHPSAFESWSLL